MAEPGAILCNASSAEECRDKTKEASFAGMKTAALWRLTCLSSPIERRGTEEGVGRRWRGAGKDELRRGLIFPAPTIAFLLLGFARRPARDNTAVLEGASYEKVDECLFWRSALGCLG